MADSRPLVMTDWADAISTRPDGSHIPLPGRPVTVAFVNRHLNTEDACSISKELTESGMMAWSGIINHHPPPMRVTSPRE